MASVGDSSVRARREVAAFAKMVMLLFHYPRP